jgi:hypothetical protein
MRRSFGLGVACLALLCIACTSVFAQEFSADMVTNERGTPHNSKLYVTKNKIHIDNIDQQQKGSVIMNYDTQKILVVMPDRHMYMEMPFDQAQKQGNHFMFFQAMNAEDACADWQKMTDRPGRSCQKVSDDVVNGRPAVKYATVSDEGKNGTVWIDKDLKFPVKWDENGNTGELKNIQMGSQAASLFEPPAGYQKFDMGNMMMKQQH